MALPACGDHLLRRLPDVPLGVAVGPQAGDVVELPGVELHEDALAVGVGEDVGGRRGHGPADRLEGLLRPGHHLAEGLFHADGGNRRRDRHIEGRVVVLVTSVAIRCRLSWAKQEALIDEVEAADPRSRTPAKRRRRPSCSGRRP